LNEPAFYFIHARHFAFSEAKEVSIPAANNGQEFVFLPVA